ncbi:hypothetical protein WJX81_006384 [Elliptochloris bilobata]|uniref:Maltase n=1 Tax=Elliptochloris bilobata TaxID=381761 RepID=A0AAW1RNV0_9CHLO
MFFSCALGVLRTWSSFGPRVDCGYLGIQEGECVSRGCCWLPAGGNASLAVDQPWCFHSNTGRSEYLLSRASDSGVGLSATLTAAETTAPELGPDVERLALHVSMPAPGVLRVRMTAAGAPRWEVPQWLYPADSVAGGGVGASKDGAWREHFEYDEEPFSFVVRRNHSGVDMEAPLFDTRDKRLVFKDQYLELTTTCEPEATLYGLGERTSSAGLRLRRDGQPLALWARDCGSAFPDVNLYSSWPYWLEVRPDGSAHGVLLLNSNGMDVVVARDRASFRAVGGVLDLFVLLGPTPADVTAQLAAVVGRPALPPFWSLGFHQSKWGYSSVEELQEVSVNYSAAGLPLEVLWSDIDYMDQFRDFTLNPTAFAAPKMQALVRWLHARGQKWVPIVDPGIKIDPGYPAYDLGLAAKVFVTDAHSGEPYVGQVWPGAVHYPDFLSPAAAAYWEAELRAFFELAHYDGLWIDMNEPSNFASDMCRAAGFTELERYKDYLAGALGSSMLDIWWSHTHMCNGSDFRSLPRAVSAPDYDFPPYQIANGNQMLPLGAKTVAMTALHHNGTLEYDAHNLYGLAEARVTAEVMKRMHRTRPFILTRSSFPGTGAHAAHWSGDNAATWEDLRWSVPSVLAPGLAGIPLVGADICGFSDNTTEELCSRWISAGAFYPFSRNHGELLCSPQELYRWPSVAAAGRRALGLRYRLLTYMYYHFDRATAAGAPVARPLWFEFPGDAVAREADTQWLLGDGVLVSPVLEQGADSVEAYFPAGTWYDAWDEAGAAPPVVAGPGGRRERLAAPLGDVPVHLRGGAVLPLQAPGLTTAAAREGGLTLVVALPEQGGAVPERTPECRAALALLRGAGAPGTVEACGGALFDDGDNLQDAGVSHRLTFATRAWRDSVNSLVGELLVVFEPRQGAGRTGPLQEGACGSAALPRLEAVRVLGASPAPGLHARLETLHPLALQGASGTAGAPPVLRRVTPAPEQVGGGEHALHLTGLDHELRCLEAVRVTWSAGGDSELPSNA